MAAILFGFSGPVSLSHIDGPFQTYSSLDLLSSDGWLGEGKVLYLGTLPIALVGLFAAPLPFTPAAVETASAIVTIWLFLIAGTFWLTLYCPLVLPLRRAAVPAVATMLAVTAFALSGLWAHSGLFAHVNAATFVEAGLSLRGLRAVLPFLALPLLYWLLKQGHPWLAGVATGPMILWSPDLGVPTYLAFALMTLLQSGGRFSLIVKAGLASTISTLLILTVATGFAPLRYIALVRSMADDQFWSFMPFGYHTRFWSISQWGSLLVERHPFVLAASAAFALHAVTFALLKRWSWRLTLMTALLAATWLSAGLLHFQDMLHAFRLDPLRWALGLALICMIRDYVVAARAAQPVEPVGAMDRRLGYAITILMLAASLVFAGFAGIGNRLSAGWGCHIAGEGCPPSVSPGLQDWAASARAALDADGTAEAERTISLHYSPLDKALGSKPSTATRLALHALGHDRDQWVRQLETGRFAHAITTAPGVAHYAVEPLYFWWFYRELLQWADPVLNDGQYVAWSRRDRRAFEPAGAACSVERIAGGGLSVRAEGAVKPNFLYEARLDIAKETGAHRHLLVTVHNMGGLQPFEVLSWLNAPVRPERWRHLFPFITPLDPDSSTINVPLLIGSGPVLIAPVSHQPVLLEALGCRLYRLPFDQPDALWVTDPMHPYYLPQSFTD